MIQYIMPSLLLLSVVGCKSSAPSNGPIGAGLSVIGLGIVIAALVVSVCLRGGGK